MKKKSTNVIKSLPKDNLEIEITQDLGSRNINWFPGHMQKALNKIKDTLRMVDIVLEVRDARSPLVTGNRDVELLIGNKNILIVLNKANLADPEIISQWQVWFEKQNKPFVFVNALDKNSISVIIQMSRDLVNKNRLLENPDNKLKEKLKMMVIGLPNTGKSTIINRLANRDASKVANRPGQTQHQLWVNVSEDLQILDNPGVMPHRIVKEEHGIWLSALHAIPDKVVDIERTAIYIIEHFAKNKPEVLKNVYKISFEKPDFLEILNSIARARGCLRQKGEFDYERVYRLILSDFRDGLFGLVSFGVPPKDKL